MFISSVSMCYNTSSAIGVAGGLWNENFTKGGNGYYIGGNYGIPSIPGYNTLCYNLPFERQ